MQSLLNKKPALDKFILDFLDQIKVEFKEQFFNKDAFSKLEKFVISGKSVRGCLFLNVCEEFNNNFAKEHKLDLLHIATALELIHSGLLIHDDIIDQDALRRGSPSIWKQYEQEASSDNFKNEINYGQSLAICAGSIAQYLARISLSKANGLGLDILSKVQVHIDKEIIKTYFAEMLDSKLAAQTNDPNLEEVLEMYLFKTARYTFSLPLQLAAIVNGFTDSQINNFGLVGEKLGLIFQIKDDQFSLFSKESSSGKSFASDIREGKKTVYYVSLLPDLSSSKKEFFKAKFGHKDLTKNEIDKIQTLFQEYAAPKIDLLLKKLEGDALKLIKNLSVGQNLLNEMLDFNLNRKN